MFLDQLSKCGSDPTLALEQDPTDHFEFGSAGIRAIEPLCKKFYFPHEIPREFPYEINNIGDVKFEYFPFLQVGEHNAAWDPIIKGLKEIKYYSKYYKSRLG